MTLRALPIIAALIAAAPAAAQDLAGRYRLADGPDVAGALELGKDGTFGYELAAGALDERAQGTWEMQDGADRPRACLTTRPTPTPPEFQPAEPISGDGSTIRVTWPPRPDGTLRGIAGIDFTIGFDSGDPLTGYTQEDGWSMPPEERRIPRWIELIEPIHRITMARTPLHGRFRAVLMPNDLGVVNFQDACFEAGEDGLFVLHRKEGDMKFRKAGK
ncbi:MAG: hypothetical protein QM676_12265 [Novosphingobium sp.]